MSWNCSGSQSYDRTSSREGTSQNTRRAKSHEDPCSASANYDTFTPCLHLTPSSLPQPRPRPPRRHPNARLHVHLRADNPSIIVSPWHCGQALQALPLDALPHRRSRPLRPQNRLQARRQAHQLNQLKEKTQQYKALAYL